MQDIQINRILFPTDFSESSKAAADFTAALAKTAHSKVWLLHVMPNLSGWHGASELYFDRDGMLPSGDCGDECGPLTALKRLEAERFAGVVTQACLHRGGVAEGIAEYANQIDADLIAMPTRGWGPIRRFFIGSTTAKVLRESGRPLLTSAHPREVHAFPPHRHILCAVDSQALCSSQVLRAASMAKLFHTRLTFVTAIPSENKSDHDIASRSSQNRFKREATAAVKQFIADLGVAADVEVLEGSVGEVVRQAAIVDNSELILVAHGHLDQPMGHLRTHAYEIIWNAPCPVLVA